MDEARAAEDARLTSRRRFLETCGRAGLALAGGALGSVGARARAAPPPGLRPMFPDPARRLRGDSSVVAAWRQGHPPTPTDVPSPDPRIPAPPPLARRFPDLRRHFIFDYYPWYGGGPLYEHWDQWERVPPLDLGSNYVPRLGAYDVRQAAVLAQHARWIAEAGVGAVALSWWGRGSWEDNATSLIFDVMKDHDLKVTFGLEPYANDRGRYYAADILYLVRQFGEKRGFDAFLLLKDEFGKEGPLFKGFRCILPDALTDCHNVTRPVPDYTTDDEWRRQTDALRDALRGSFDHVTLLADSLEFRRTPLSGFDGISIYDNFIRPDEYAGYAAGASKADLVYSFNINPGYDSIEPRTIQASECYVPPPFAPPTQALDFTRAEDRERAAQASAERIAASCEATLRIQTDPASSNVRKGFFLAYINSFNEWHEGHMFEPMKDAAELTPAERAFPYHNPRQGAYRLETLGRLVRATQG